MKQMMVIVINLFWYSGLNCLEETYDGHSDQLVWYSGLNCLEETYTGHSDKPVLI